MNRIFPQIKAGIKYFLTHGGRLRRPGTDLPIVIASTDHVSLHDGLAEDFFRRVLDKDYGDIWISDESSLWDFHTELSNEHLHKKIWEIYGVDVSDIKNGNLVKIFERIERAGA